MAYKLPFGDPIVVDSTKAFPVTGLFGDPMVVSSVRATTAWSDPRDMSLDPMTLEMADDE